MSPMPSPLRPKPPAASRHEAEQGYDPLTGFPTEFCAVPDCDRPLRVGSDPLRHRAGRPALPLTPEVLAQRRERTYDRQLAHRLSLESERGRILELTHQLDQLQAELNDLEARVDTFREVLSTNISSKRLSNGGKHAKDQRKDLLLALNQPKPRRNRAKSAQNQAKPRQIALTGAKSVED